MVSTVNVMRTESNTDYSFTQILSFFLLFLHILSSFKININLCIESSSCILRSPMLTIVFSVTQMVLYGSVNGTLCSILLLLHS